MPYQDGGPFVAYSPEPDPRIMMSYDRVPKGAVESTDEIRVGG